MKLYYHTINATIVNRITKIIILVLYCGIASRDFIWWFDYVSGIHLRLKKIDML